MSLGYHGISAAETGSYLTVRLDEFRWQINFLQKHFKLGTVEEILESTDTKPMAAITIDDCYAELVPDTTDFINTENIPVTYFAPSGLLGSTIDVGGKPLAVLDSDQLRNLEVNRGTNGSHTVSHRQLTDLAPDQQKDEISRSKSDLEQLTGHEISSFAYPRGKYDQSIRDMVEQAGYRYAVTVDSSSISPGYDPFLLPRISVHRSTSQSLFKFKMTNFGDALLRFRNNRKIAR